MKKIIYFNKENINKINKKTKWLVKLKKSKIYLNKNIFFL